MPSSKIPAEIRRTLANFDHVVPKSKGGKGRWVNLVLAHEHCNVTKGASAPYPCELLFLEFTNEIVADIKRALEFP